MTWFSGLRTRVVLLMSVALLPIGLIALVQTNGVSVKSRENSELARLALTEQAAVEERILIQRASGVAQSLAVAIGELMRDPVACSAVMRKLVNDKNRFSLVGFIQANGKMTCSSAAQTYDFSATEAFAQALAQPQSRITVNRDAPISQSSVVIVSEPAFAPDGTLLGFIAVSIPHKTLLASDATKPDALLDLITFKQDGEILSNSAGFATVADRLPAQRALTDFVGQPQQAFTGLDNSGVNRTYAVVPIQQNRIYALGVWTTRTGATSPWASRWAVSLFPAVMWLTSLGVALFAVHHMVTRHVGRVARQMHEFARTRRVLGQIVADNAPDEIQQIQTSFLEMTQTILRDEAELEDAVREKSVLIKEIHHRVKNNLQLISSIINMQLRQIDDPSTRSELRRIQDRVISLATIHRDLYQGNIAGHVNVGDLLREIISNTVEIGLGDNDQTQVDLNIDDIRLFPDQAVPMSLLASEATTNVMKYLGPDKTGQAWISVTLKEDSPGICTFTVSNSQDDTAQPKGTGLGAQLINAFVLQLGAQLTTTDAADRYQLTVEFSIAEFSEDTA